MDEYKTRLQVNGPNHYKSSTYQLKLKDSYFMQVYLAYLHILMVEITTPT